MSQLYVDNIKNRTGDAGVSAATVGKGASGIVIVRYSS